MTPKAQATKGKIDTLYFIKIRNFCASKGHHLESEKTRMEKIFANHISDKRLLSRIYIELLQRKPNNSIKKWAYE